MSLEGENDEARESIREDSRDAWFFLAVGLKHAWIDSTPERAPDSTDLAFHLNRLRRWGGRENDHQQVSAIGAQQASRTTRRSVTYLVENALRLCG
ncbi:hypothetical protein [Candidatus Thiosymbion oneisti]|uniref:hypothetical protein n=1 Tax=Candidatus Thiosymbion oneisti TaxID=589554 RepID=UPI00105F4306|nr:hypothetical protein [Candidatus Thiosymbion oneisti]